MGKEIFILEHWCYSSFCTVETYPKSVILALRTFLCLREIMNKVFLNVKHLPHLCVLTSEWTVALCTCLVVLSSRFGIAFIDSQCSSVSSTLLGLEVEIYFNLNPCLARRLTKCPWENQYFWVFNLPQKTVVQLQCHSQLVSWRV